LAHAIQLAPSILAADFTRLGAQIADAEAAGADLIHIDVMDGRFVPNLTMGPLVVEAARRATRLPLDVHLMMVEPDHMLEEFVKAGASTLHVHWETGFHLHRTLSKIKALGCQAGIAVNPHTPALVLTEVLSLIDIVLVMTVNPGFGGQAFIPETLDKIRQLRALIQSQGKAIDLMVDGGINVETAPAVVNAGANILVVGSAVFNPTHSIEEGITRLRAVLPG
jgi:ribulose-phosphate 3-epimerase